MKMSCREEINKLKQEIEELKRKLKIVIEQLYHKAGIEIYIEEKR